jgi:arylsulfatase A
MKNLFFTALLSLFLSSCDYGVQQQPPNFVIIYADDLGYGDVSSYGVGRLQTPSIDKIANNGS